MIDANRFTMLLEAYTTAAGAAGSEWRSHDGRKGLGIAPALTLGLSPVAREGVTSHVAGDVVTVAGRYQNVILPH